MNSIGNWLEKLFINFLKSTPPSYQISLNSTWIKLRLSGILYWTKVLVWQRIELILFLNERFCSLSSISNYSMDLPTSICTLKRIFEYILPPNTVNQDFKSKVWPKSNSAQSNSLQYTKELFYQQFHITALWVCLTNSDWNWYK